MQKFSVFADGKGSKYVYPEGAAEPVGFEFVGIIHGEYVEKPLWHGYEPGCVLCDIFDRHVEIMGWTPACAPEIPLKAEASFLDRLVAEKEELSERLNKLSDFLVSRKIDSIDSLQLSLLRTQADAMRTYKSILELRIKILQK